MMKTIRYICMSDLHFGAGSSLFTSMKPPTQDEKTGRLTARRGSRILRQFARSLRLLAKKHSRPGKRPTLVLNGDILELALADLDDALTVFEDFLVALFPKGETPLFDTEILYLPGNHDHHMWELSREEEYIRRRKKNAPPFHTVSADRADGLRSPLLEETLRRVRSDLKVRVSYPNLALSADERTVVIHHGHFTERIYYQISQMRNLIFPGRTAPQTLEEIESENFAWIDFFWSTLGRSGPAGKDLELIYNKLHDPTQTEKMLHRFAIQVSAKNHPPSLWDTIRGTFVYIVIRAATRRILDTEIHQGKEPLNESSRKLMQWYLSVPVKHQIGDVKRLGFLFGHTHKPFSENVSLEDGASVDVYNSGGWVVETPDVIESHGGNLLLLDEKLACYPLHVFNEGEFTPDAMLPEGDRLKAMIVNGIRRRRMRLIRRIQSEGTMYEKVLLMTKGNEWKKHLGSGLASGPKKKKRKKTQKPRKSRSNS
ncbi:hypothetical protein Lepil_0862 [Leptonema illini DSM 21528]|uniref:Calcineurin-like phosphoesterase domain-containing protein n=2 Tax=Leptonema illini TaxID=183 RepID=H2CEH7_9LEPT|nr:metallophosphoesterase [Leptonema illini]EHQ05563.1 hypothetical protein Lepil_0862 [Leptonema illini DSM 21528]